MLEVRGLSVSYGTFEAVRNVSFSVRPGQWLMVVGPNGAGKSTVAFALARRVEYSGKVLLGGVDTAAMKSRELARKIGVLSQNHHAGYAFTVEEIVRMGRYAYTSAIGGMKPEDEEKVEQALEETGLTELRGQSVLKLSGGEVQRTFLAQVLAQDPQILVLDEPTNHLDLMYQKQVFELIGEWVKSGDRAVISVVHDLSLAKACGSHALLMDKGRAIGLGETESVLTSENLQSVYSMDVYAWMRNMLRQW